ncbi:MAG: hypothetical protein J5844_00710, partial [Clostridia bacterium]|nr:hypothetical protein [Clostridia bacterium]
VIGVPQTFTNFLRMQERITDFIVKNSRADKSTINELIMKTDEIASDVGTVIDGVKAVEIGLIDRVGNLHDAVSELKSMIVRRKKG